MGRRAWLERDLESAWFPAFEALSDDPDGHEKATWLCNELRASWVERGFVDLRRQQSLMDATRLAIKKKWGKDYWLLDWIRFSKEEYVTLNNLKQDLVAARNEAVVYLDEPDAIVAHAVRLLDSPEWAVLVAALAVLTGRRSSEILSTAVFEPASLWSVWFSGSLKRRGELQELRFEIPTLTTAQRVCEALQKVRLALPDAAKLTAGQVNQKYGAAVIRACDQHFANLVPLPQGKDNLYTHLFRSVYASIAAFWFCPPRVNETEFKAAIQGHYALLDEQDPALRRSLAASRHYSDFEIADKVIALHGGKRLGVKLGWGGILPIQVFQQAWEEQQSTDLETPTLRKEGSSLRIWKPDKARLEAIFERLNLEQERQADRVALLLDWVEEQFLLADQEGADAVVSPLIVQKDQQEGEEISVLQDQVLLEPVVEQKQEGIPGSEVGAMLGKMDTLIDVLQQFVSLQIQGAQGNKAAPRTRDAKSTPVPPSDNDDKPEVKSPGKRRNDSSILHRAIDAIMEHNNQPGRLHDDKWAITINTLKSFMKSQPAILRVLEERQDEVEAHHALHGIEARTHNLRHRRKSTIADVIPFAPANL